MNMPLLLYVLFVALFIWGAIMDDLVIWIGSVTGYAIIWSIFVIIKFIIHDRHRRLLILLHLIVPCSTLMIFASAVSWNSKNIFYNAVSNGHKSVVRYYLNNGMGADTIPRNLGTNDGVVPLINSILHKDSEMVELLLSHGANPNAKEQRSGVTALMYASQGMHPEIVRILLSHDADVNAKAEDGITALIFASGSGNIEIVKMLLAKGADVSVQTKDGMSSITLAEKRKYYDVMTLLREKENKQKLP